MVSLDYQNRVLLVSTEVSAWLLSPGPGGRWGRVRVGTQDRGRPGLYGAVLFAAGPGRSGLRAVVARPGCRVWVADTAGRVQQTVILQAALQRAHTEIPLLNPALLVGEAGPDSFGRLAMLPGGEAVLWGGDRLHIVNLAQAAVLASCSALRNILDLAVTTDEIFVLESGRELVRLSRAAEPLSARPGQISGTLAQAANTTLQIAVESLASHPTSTSRITFTSMHDKLDLATPSPPGSPAVEESEKVQ